MKSVAVTTVLSLPSSSVYSAEFYAPQPDGFIADSDASFCLQILYITVTEIESIIEPDCVTDDVRREPMTLVSIH